MERWRAVRHHEPLRADVTVTYDGIDTSLIDESEFDRWWHRMTDDAPTEWLTTKDFSREATVSSDGEQGYSDVIINDDAPLRRAVEIRLEGWLNNAIIVKPMSRIALMQLNPYTRAGIASPIAIRINQWHYRLYPGTSEKLEILTGVDESSYRVDERLTDLIFPRENKEGK